MHAQWKIGDRLIHPEHGAADVRFVGNDYIGLHFSDDQEALVRLDDMAMFIPVDGGDIDDYQFRGPVKVVEPFDDFLGQSGWRVRVTVMRLSEYAHEDFDIDLLVTRRAWEGNTPPRLGQDIEGALWLQGRLLDPDETKA